MAENWTIDSVRSALGAKKISARELAKEYFSRIAAQNPKLNVYLALSEERAYAQADRVDAMVAAGKPLPALAGVPVALKDVLSTRGVTTTCGSKILEKYVPPYDATAVARLEANPSLRSRLGAAAAERAKDFGLVEHVEAVDFVLFVADAERGATSE